MQAMRWAIVLRARYSSLDEAQAGNVFLKSAMSRAERKRAKLLAGKYPASDPCACSVWLTYRRRPGWWIVKQAAAALGAGYNSSVSPNPLMLMNRTHLVLPILFAIFSCTGSAQDPRFEIGVQLSGLRENVLGEYPLGGGGKVTVRALRFVAAEAEVDRYPIGGGTALYPATQVSLGARVGRRIGPLGIYGIARPGWMSFDTNAYVPKLGIRPALDFGAALEFYSRRHMAARMDVGDSVVWYGLDAIPAIYRPGPSIVPGARHQLHWTLGFSFWF
jgi:hypothetical protein